MKVGDLALATDLVCRRAKLLNWLTDVRKGRFVISIGDVPVSGAGMPMLKEMLLEHLSLDLARCNASLEELGLEIEDAEEAASLPSIRVEAESAMAAAR